MSANQAVIRAHMAGSTPQRVLTPVTAGDLLRRVFPPRENVLAPWLPTQGLAMLYGPRGAGKTHVSLGVAYAVASGGAFLRWRAERPRRVLFVDGEMPGVALQERLALISEKAQAEPPAEDYLRFIAADLEPEGIPDLSTLEGQDALESQIGDSELIVLDNLSTLCRSGRENEAESWGSVQEFALRLRRQGRSVLFIHHAGKSGSQRGTSRREDVLDTVVNLRRPDDYVAAEGAKFIVSFEKSRGFMGKDAEPFEAALDIVTGEWSTRDVEDIRDAKIVELASDGLSQTDIANELGVNKSTVCRSMGRLREQGRI
jgi:hypothetical protein